MFATSSIDCGRPYSIGLASLTTAKTSLGGGLFLQQPAQNWVSCRQINALSEKSKGDGQPSADEALPKLAGML
jgi:hypothetical protein